MHDQLLQNLGLTKDEARIFELLLGIGEATVQKLLPKSGLKRGSLYNILRSLRDKELVIEKTDAKKLTYEISPPNKLESLIATKQTQIEENKKRLADAMPQLKSVYNLALHKPNVQFFEGVEGIKKVYEDTLKENNKEIFAFVATDAPDPQIAQWLKNTYVKKRISLKINAKVIAAQTPEAIAYKGRDNQELRKTTLVSKDEFPFAMEINIYEKNKVAFISYASQELIGVIIESPAIYKTMKAIFNLSWQQA